MMSLGIKKFCPYENTECKHCCNWEVDDIDENGRHIIWREFECDCEGKCVKEAK